MISSIPKAVRILGVTYRQKVIIKLLTQLYIHYKSN